MLTLVSDSADPTSTGSSFDHCGAKKQKKMTLRAGVYWNALELVSGFARAHHANAIYGLSGR